ncbi:MULTISPECIES: hypothetical protein [unclassified Bradyrhizobium]
MAAIWRFHGIAVFATKALLVQATTDKTSIRILLPDVGAAGNQV